VDVLELPVGILVEGADPNIADALTGQRGPSAGGSVRKRLRPKRAAVKKGRVAP
jgi:hypothetical protein